MDGIRLLIRWLRFLPGLLVSALLVVAPVGCGKKYSSGSQDAEVTADASGLHVDGSVGICGDGNLDPGEECDDGNQRDDDECLPNCVWACGDGVVNAVELCDTGIAAGQPGACPTGCDDSNACTTDTLVGSTCLAECVYGDISTCSDDDGCCPSTCNETTDNDCSAQCDNGVVEPGETCDPISSCPTSCDDQNTCTADSMAGDPSTCDVECTNAAIATCVGGDGCCPSGCDNTTDTDCSVNCGNSVVEAGETCDPPGSCPTSCDDSNVCTTDTMTGSSANCNVACSNTVISTCTGGDGCCAPGCDSTIDSDCAVSCGNSVVEAGETCDPPGSCPTSCDDSNTCTTDVMTGSSATCNVVCTNTNVVTCTGGDACCPSTCDANNDSDCSPVCGNSAVEAGETCDPPGSCPTSCDDSDSCTNDVLTGSSATCDVVCTNTPIGSCTGGDNCCPSGCDSTSDSDCSVSCGNSVVEAGETCDPPGTCPTSCDDSDSCTADSMTGSPANCNVVCTNTPIATCTGGDGCCPGGCNQTNDTDCAPVCTNGVVEAGETCDPPGSCPTSCDDTNTCTTDVMTGAAATCDVVCTNTPIGTCTNGDSCCPAGCNAANDDDCAAVCGNSVVEPGETCDPPTSCPADCDDSDVCTTDVMTGSAASCTVACANTPISACTGGDGCCPGGCNQTNDSDCAAVCGNLVVEVGEDCDDGNADPSDGCDACQFVVQPTVYRLNDLDLRDPHVHIYALFACRDLTDTSFFGFSVNGELQTAVQTDDDGDGELDMSFLLIMRPLDQSVPGGASMDVAMGLCSAPMAGTVCDVDPSFTPQTSPYLNQNTGICLDSIPGTTDGYTPPITTPGPICFYNTSLLTLTLNMGGILIPLQDVQFGATYVGSPAADLNNGLLRGFISETDADNTILPADLPLVGGEALSSLLPGGSGNCATYDARDNNGGTTGWWFYLNWPATEVTYIGP